MSDDIVRRRDSLPAVPLPTTHPSLRRASSGLSRREQRREQRHVDYIEELRREAVEGAAGCARDAYIGIAATDAEAAVAVAEKQAEARVLIAEDEAEGRRLTELKYQLHRARKESQILGGDDLELAAKFAELDDDMFKRRRVRGGQG